jgi:hypothetical protein
MPEQAGVFRESRIQSLCRVCGEVADGVPCPRCETPVCREHQVVEGARCQQCEQTFRDADDYVKRQVLTTPQLLIVWGLMALGALPLFFLMKHAEQLTSTYLVLGLINLGLVAMLPYWALLARRSVLRARFRRERPGKISVVSPLATAPPASGLRRCAPWGACRRSRRSKGALVV